MTDWQPIETAPKDGTKVLLTIAGRQWVGIGYWIDKEEREFGKVVWRRQEWSEEILFRSPFRCAGEDDEPPRITHWLPIPPPPKTPP